MCIYLYIYVYLYLYTILDFLYTLSRYNANNKIKVLITLSFLSLRFFRFFL